MLSAINKSTVQRHKPAVFHQRQRDTWYHRVLRVCSRHHFILTNTHTHTYLVNLSFSRAQWHDGQQLVTISTSPLRHLQPHPTSSQLFPGSAKRFCTTSSLGVLFFNSLLLRSMSLLPCLVSELVRLVHALPYGICAQLQCLLCKISSFVMYTQV